MPKPGVQKIKIRKSGISVLDIELRSFLLSPLPSKCIITVQLLHGASRSFYILPRDWMGSCETSVWLRRSFISWHVGKRTQAQLLWPSELSPFSSCAAALDLVADPYSCSSMCVLTGVGMGGGPVQVDWNEVHIYTSSTSHHRVSIAVAEKEIQWAAWYNFAHNRDLVWSRNKEIHQQRVFHLDHRRRFSSLFKEEHVP